MTAVVLRGDAARLPLPDGCVDQKAGGPVQPKTLACSDCGGVLFVVMYGGALVQPKLKCGACGACWFIGKQEATS